ncbi:hypothetical protein [Rhizomonospora bruguierae]|nr:hypothetical protein [Micromonospora sp. NBRC 107566]
MHRHTTATRTWIRTEATIATHPVRVWTITDPAPPAAQEVVM